MESIFATNRVTRLGDVVITIFCDFCLFSAKKMAFLSKTNVMIKLLHNLALIGVKNGNFFAEFFFENI
jgi:hypothetical protein